MLHLVVKPYDPSIDYAYYCRQLFGDNRCLVMMEKKGGDHCHVQGECVLTEDGVKAIQQEMIAKHYRKKQDLTSRPIKKRSREADDLGFQYMAKELPDSVVVYKQGFTDEELCALYDKSNELRAELQSNLGEYLRSKCVRGPGEPPRHLHKRLCGYAVRYYLDEDKMQPPNIKLLVRHFLGKYYREEDVIEYLSELIM